MADTRPIPAPRKIRSGLHQAPPLQPGGSSTYNTHPETTTGYIYAAPVTPSNITLGGGSNVNQTTPTPTYNQQSSTPLPHTYNPPVTPTSSGGRRTKEYAGPQKVMTPQPTSGGESSECTTPSFTPRKESWNSSRSSLSSDPQSPFRIDELSAEIERCKEMKGNLIEEVGELNKQKELVTSEIESLKSEESSIRRRIAQLEQNLQLMGRLKPAVSTDSETLRRRTNELDEMELALDERDSRIRQKELELQSEADVLFQRKKELDLREYDMKNFNGPNQPMVGPAGGERNSDIIAHEERERKLQQREHELFDKENKLNDMEFHLKREQERLSKWERNVKMEDDRAQQNLKRAKEMMQEAKNIEQDALNASKAVALLEDERKETTVTSSGDTHHTTGPSTAVTTGATGGSYGATRGAQPGVSANETDCSDDLMYARMVNLQIQEEIKKKDEELVRQMSTVPEKTASSEFLESDAELAFQQQLEIMGIAPGSVDAEALKKQLLDELERHKQRQEATSRDSEIAASIRSTTD